jgi:Spy/CpxP family protein refolding chaperone
MKTSLLIAASFFMAIPAFAQGGPPPGGPNGPPPQGHMHAMNDRGPKGVHGHGQDMRGPMGRLLPPGTWWRNPEVVKAIGLSPEQQKKIDDVFLQSRMHLIDIHAALEKEQLELEPLLNANPIDQGRALAQVSKIADGRAEVEKADAKMLLNIRAVLTADQWTKLREHHPGPGRERPGGMHGRGGPMGHGPGGPGAPPQPPQ